jgi:tRNA (cytidine/uridine-2'-O-)-methyltransferase
MFRVAFFEPRIPSNTGNAIRLAAVTGAELHLIGPLGFDLSDAKLRRAGLDYHDLASVTVHDGLLSAWDVLMPARVFAFTTQATRGYTDVDYRAGDVLLFGPEPDGLPAHVLADPHIEAQVRIPMLAGRRSLNLANAASIAIYEAWRQHGFAGTAHAADGVDGADGADAAGQVSRAPEPR